MTRIFYACLSLALIAPSLASAQTVSEVTVTSADPDLVDANPAATVTWGIDDCVDLAGQLTDSITFTWAMDDPGTGQYALKLEGSGEECATTQIAAAEGDTCSRPETGDQAATVETDFTWAALIGDSITTADDCYDSGNGGNFAVHFVFERDEDSEGNAQEPSKSTVTFELNLTRPSAPTDVVVSAGENVLDVSWEYADEAEEFILFYTTIEASAAPAIPEEPGADVDSETITDGAASSGEISSGVSVGNTYYVSVSARDSVTGNLSLPSVVDSGTTQPTADFWETYRAAGGSDAGGCTSSKRGIPWLGGFALLGLLLVSRRKAAAGVLAACLLIPGMAHAELTLVQETPISGAFELKLGRYAPAVDDEFSGATPYADTFGDRNPIYLELEYDYQLWREFGSLGAFVGLGWHQIKGTAFNEDGTNSETDFTRMRTLPLRIGVVYRFDELHRRWNIPFAFSAKFGLDYYVWSIRDTNGTASTEIDGETVSGRGGTSGYHFSFGAHLLLDFLAPQMASTFDLNTGVNNTYFFAEVTIAQINDFGSDTSMNLSDTSVLFGLAFEF